LGSLDFQGECAIFPKTLWIATAVLCALATWLYFARVLIPRQIADAAVHSRPRGNLSDLYPRWLGARELLLRGRDPYSPAVTREIQQGYYGRALESSRPNDPKDQQGFAYPVYVAFCLAPTIHLPFETVRKGFFWVLLGLTAATIPLWLRLLRWPLPSWAQAGLIILTIGSLPVMQGLKLQQITLFVAALLAAALALLSWDQLIAAGVVLAVATIKPQLSGFLLLWLLFWTVSDWRRRGALAVSFLVSMSILVGLSEWYLPHWIQRFWHAVHEYQAYTGAMSVTDTLMLGVSKGIFWTRALELLVFAVLICASWKERRMEAQTEAFGMTASMVLALTVLLVPTHDPYNQVLLIPALLLLFKVRNTMWRRSIVHRVCFAIMAGLALWPWMASAVLAALSFVLPRQTVEQFWAVPFWTVIQIPVGVAALMLARYYQTAFAVPAGEGSS